MTGVGAKLTDFALLQLGWFACVLGGAGGQEWLGPVAALLVIGAHVGLVTPAGRRAVEVRNVVVFGIAGTIVDCVQAAFGAFCFADSPATLCGLPLWMAALWFQFPILFNTTLAWLRGRVVLAAVFGLVGGPLAYAAGESLGALELGSERVLALGAVALVWAVYTPLALRFSRS